MSKVIGKRSSKWDLTSESRYQADTSVSNTEVDDRSSLYHDNKSKSSWPSRSDGGHDRRSSHADNFHSTELKDDRRDSKNLKRSGRAYRGETSPLSRMRGREDDYAVSMSPGLDSWRESNCNRSHSPRNKWSSRSCRCSSCENNIAIFCEFVDLGQKLNALLLLLLHSFQVLSNYWSFCLALDIEKTYSTQYLV